MLSLLIIGITSVYCGVACGHRNIPVPVGITVTIVAGIFGMLTFGALGSFAMCCTVGFAFAMIPVPKETFEDLSDDGFPSSRHSRGDSREVIIAERVDAEPNPYSAPSNND